MWLQLSSFFLATVSLHAILVKRYIVCMLWLLQNQASIMHHGNFVNPINHPYGHIIASIDKFVAHTNWLYALWRSTYLSPYVGWSWVVWGALCYTMASYYLFLKKASTASYMPPFNMQVVGIHASLHAAAAAGLHALLKADTIAVAVSY